MSNNDFVVLVTGKSTTGKSACIRNIKNQENWVYLNCEGGGKRLPFKHKFREMHITDPMQVYDVFKTAEDHPSIAGIVVDSITYLMDMYETMYVNTAADSRKAWGNYAQYFKNLMQVCVQNSTKKVVMTAHTLDQLNETEMLVETKVPVKGALKNQGIESYFSTVISTKKIPLSEAEKHVNPLLTITPQDQSMKAKYVFQTQITGSTVNDRIRGPMGLFELSEVYIDNDIQLVLDRLQDYYGVTTQQASA